MLSFLKRIYQSLSSLRFTVMILLVIAAISMVGTILPQGMTEEAVLSFYGETSWKARAIIFLGLTDLYHTLWFQALIGLLAVNVSLCTTERFPKTLKLWAHKERELNADKLRKFNNFSELSSLKNFEEVISSLKGFFHDHGWKKEFDRVGEETFEGIFSKRRVLIFSIYGVHLSVMLVLLGAFLGSFFGFKGTMALLQGDSTNMVKLMRKDKALMLPFEVRCDRFYVKFYSDGTPSEYVSEVTILEGEKEVLKKSIRVNDPLTYKGINFYQATYGTIISKAKVNFVDEKTGESFELTLSTQKEDTIPGSNTLVQLMDYRDNFSNLGPAVAVGMMEEGVRPRAGWILLNHPDFHGNRLGRYRVSVRDVEVEYYTGFQVKRDPGLWLVLTGFSGLVLFMLTTFYGSPTRVWCLAEKHGGSVKIYIAMKSKGGSQAERFTTLFRNVKRFL
ncbi:MAG: cytochrome c biogenesis protein ResB [Syntrophobacterales bacterium]|nr:cytochrome c biogenesis protein ResB [Syntrophobacterales bacterium]